MKKIFSMNSIFDYFLKKDSKFYLLVLIILLASFLRLYNFPYRYSLGDESVRDAVIGIEGARELQLPLTGAFSSLGPFTFGPWYAYQLGISTLLFRSILSPWIYLTIISIVYVFIMYKIGSLLEGKNFGLILALIAAISPAQVISATHLTSHNTTNLFAVLAIWFFLILVLKKRSYWLGFFLGFVIGIGINLHFQMVGLLVLPLILFIYNRKKYMYFLTAAAGVLASFLPLFFFEVNNHWFNTRNLIYYMFYGKNLMYVPNRWLFYLRDFWPSFWADALGGPVWIGNVVIVFVLILLAWSIYKKKLKLQVWLLLLAFIINFIILRYYWGPRFFGYLNFMRPFVFIFTTFAIVRLSQTKVGKLGAALLLILIIGTSIPRNISQLIRDPFSMEMYKGMSDLEKTYPNSNFTLYTCSTTYKTATNATNYSTLFILELKHKLSSNGIRIGFKSDCNYPDKKTYPSLSSIGILDFSSTTDLALKNNGWKIITFQEIYESYARWWFRLKP